MWGSLWPESHVTQGLASEGQLYWKLLFPVLGMVLGDQCNTRCFWWVCWGQMKLNSTAMALGDASRLQSRQLESKQNRTHQFINNAENKGQTKLISSTTLLVTWLWLQRKTSVTPLPQCPVFQLKSRHTWKFKQNDSVLQKLHCLSLQAWSPSQSILVY